MNIFDKAICAKLHMTTTTWGWFEYLMAVFAAMFNSEVLAFYWAIALVQLPWRISSFLAALLIPGVTMTIVLPLKRMTGRDRPATYPPRARVLRYDFRGKEKHKSMPSGDSAQAAAFWSYLAMNALVPWWVSVFLTLLTMLARVYYMCHYPTDTVVGALLGTFIALVADCTAKVFWPFFVS